MSVPELVAHRGYPLRYPENTLVGIEAALACGATYVEVDVQLSADGEPVLFHDRTLQRVCGVPGAVHELSLSRLRSLRAAEPDFFGDRFRDVRIATLAEFAALVRRYPAVSVFVEIKPVASERFGAELCVDRVLGAIEKLRSRCAIISGAVDVVEAARRRGGPVGLVLRTLDQAREPAVRALAPEHFFLNAFRFPGSRDLRLPDGRLVVYDVVDPAMAIRLHRRGAPMVESFAVGEMLEAFRRQAGSER